MNVGLIPSTRPLLVTTRRLPSIVEHIGGPQVSGHVTYTTRCSVGNVLGWPIGVDFLIFCSQNGLHWNRLQAPGTPAFILWNGRNVGFHYFLPTLEYHREIYRPAEMCQNRFLEMEKLIHILDTRVDRGDLGLSKVGINYFIGIMLPINMILSLYFSFYGFSTYKECGRHARPRQMPCPAVVWGCILKILCVTDWKEFLQHIVLTTVFLVIYIFFNLSTTLSLS